MFIQIKTDLDELKTTLDEFNLSMPTLTRRVLGKAGMSGKKAIKGKYKQFFRVRTGRLYKGAKYSVRKSGNSVVIYSGATSDATKKGARYGFVLAHGATITAKKSKYLTFMNEKGEWRKVKSITLPVRDWIESPVESYLASATYTEDKEAILQKHIDKYFAN
jgi:hypothetical protein